MASSAEIHSVEDLERKLGEIEMPWEDIAPRAVGSWLDTYAKAHGTCRELLLGAMLPCTSALLGNASVKLFDSWKEKGNLFVIGLAPSGAGKTPACNIGVVMPLISHLEPRIERSLLVDETSANGLFNHFVNNQKGGDQVHVPVLCTDEAFSFTNKLVSTSRSVSQTSLTMERICKLYDGDYWYTVKGSKGKRCGVQSARMSMASFSTPRRFLTDVWPKVVASKNGLADRILILYSHNDKTDIETIEACSTALQDSPVKGLGTVYEIIYNEHHQDNAVEYTLSASAREIYLKYCKGHSSEKSRVSTGSFTPECNAKTSKNALRIVLNLHVLWHRLGKALNQLVGPTPAVICEDTMNMGLTLHDTLLSYGGVAEACLKLKQGSSGIKMTVSPEDVKHRVLTIPGPYTTVKRVYNSFSSSSRPSPQLVQSCLHELQAESLGTSKRVQKSTYFYKVIPIELEHAQEKLGAYNISLEQYKQLFLQKDELLTSEQMEKLADHHPQPDEMHDYLDSNLERLRGSQ